MLVGDLHLKAGPGPGAQRQCDATARLKSHDTKLKPFEASKKPQSHEKHVMKTRKHCDISLVLNKSTVWKFSRLLFFFVTPSILFGLCFFHSLLPSLRIPHVFFDGEV